MHLRKLQRFEFHEELLLPWQQKEKTWKIFLFQTLRARAFIFGMYHHLVALYQNTSNYGPGVEISPMLWVLGFHIEIKKEFLYARRRRDVFMWSPVAGRQAGIPNSLSGAYLQDYAS